MAKLCEYGSRLSQMSSLEVIRAAREHLLTQGKKSLSPSEHRMYNGVGGLCCAAAPFFEKYSPDMEGQSWVSLQKNSAANSCKKHDRLIDELQTIHDIDRVEDWEEELDALERNYVPST